MLYTAYLCERVLVLFVYSDYDGPQEVGVFDTIQQLEQALKTRCGIDTIEWTSSTYIGPENWFRHNGTEYVYHQVTHGVISKID